MAPGSGSAFEVDDFRFFFGFDLIDRNLFDRWSKSMSTRFKAVELGREDIFSRLLRIWPESE